VYCEEEGKRTFLHTTAAPQLQSMPTSFTGPQPLAKLLLWANLLKEKPIAVAIESATGPLSGAFTN
jgi:hypothetical protein